MDTALYLTLDCSTTAAKAVVFDANGRAVGVGARPISMQQPHPGWHEQDPEQWWGASRDALRDAVASLPDPALVVALCVTHQRESFVCLDADDRPLRPAILWVDTRAAAEIAEFGSASVGQLSGKPPDVTPALYKLAWLSRHEPGTLREATRVGDVQAFLCCRLTGRWATGVGSADALGLFDLANRTWSDELLAIAGVRRDQLPSLVPSAEPLGQLLPDVCMQLGLPGPIPLVAGTGDGQAAGLGAAAVVPGRAYLNLGTSMVMGVTSPQYITSPAFRTLAGPVSDTYVLETLLNSAGYLMTWFVREFGDGTDLAALERDAARVGPGCDGLLTLPYWNAVQSPYWDPLARGATVGWHGGHTRAHFYRSLLEGVAFELRLHLAGLEEATGSAIGEIRAVGGGTRNQLWVQILADVTGRRIDLLSETEISAKGAAVLAKAFASSAAGLAGTAGLAGVAGLPGAGGGNSRIGAVAEAMAGTVRGVAPGPAAERYSQLYERYRALYPALRAVFASS